MKTAKGQLMQARMYASFKMPYFTKVLYALAPLESATEITLSVTRRLVLRYSVPFVLQTDAEVLGGCLLHEVLHILLRHWDRAEVPDDADLMGQELGINSMLTAAKVALPPQCYFPSQFGLPEGKTSEWYAAELRKMQATNTGSTVCNGKCGGVSGEYDDHVDTETDSNNAPIAKEEIEVEDIIKQAVEMAKGKLPGFNPGRQSEKLAKPTIKGKVQWQRVLTAHMGRATTSLTTGTDDYSIRRPSKRGLTKGEIRPGPVAYSPTPAFIMDTSVSMSDRDMHRVQVEIMHCMQKLNIENVWFLQADADLSAKPVLASVRDVAHLHETIKGRGGTEFDPAIIAANKLRNPAPDFMVYGTDGYGRVHVKPRMPLLWLVVNEHVRTMPFGKVVNVY